MARKVLVIDDNAENLELMLYLLHAFGFETRSARDGLEGLAAIEREIPDLVICDVHMPRLDGFGVIERLKSDPALQSVRVLAVTALAMVGDAERVLKAGFDGYVSKPIDPETFVGTLERYLKR
jgi:CheY-like chemotaxis protein